MTIRIAIMLICVVCALIAAHKARVAAATARATEDDAQPEPRLAGPLPSATHAPRR